MRQNTTFRFEAPSRYVGIPENLCLSCLNAFVFLGKLLQDRADTERLQKILAFVEEAALFVEDAFPEARGNEKLNKAIAYLKTVLAQTGIHFSDAEAEVKVRTT